VTGLAFREADLDICLLTEILPVDREAAYSTRLGAVQSETLKESAVGETLSTLQRVAQCLRQKNSGCGQVKVITGTKCPVVQFSATDIDLQCDLSVCNR
jgi:DNA polymerase sigma